MHRIAFGNLGIALGKAIHLDRRAGFGDDLAIADARRFAAAPQPPFAPLELPGHDIVERRRGIGRRETRDLRLRLDASRLNGRSDRSHGPGTAMRWGLGVA
ncbi:hypothetical protein D9M70_496740 [compost metagenome]